uniref:Uncharacterized protein n=1 Tax=Rhizophora mucronata TaxID=61149 RepID=A0A2P2N073_RHIMU
MISLKHQGQKTATLV